MGLRVRLCCAGRGYPHMYVGVGSNGVWSYVTDQISGGARRSYPYGRTWDPQAPPFSPVLICTFGWLYF